MATITLRSSLSRNLTANEVDDNFTNLNTEVGTKLNSSDFDGDNILQKIADGEALMLPIANGGTGATTKLIAQQNLDLEVGVDVQEYSEIF